MDKQYFIKQGTNYLHNNGDEMRFLPTKQGADVFFEEDADSVLAVLRNAGVAGTFKARVKKTKFIQREESALIKPVQEFRKKRARKRLKKY